MNFGSPINKTVICILVLLVSGCSGPAADNAFVLDRLLKKTAWKNSPSAFIAHAGGSIGLQTYTNSEEAILKSIRDGMKLIEIDLIETNDGHLVGAHDWAHFKSITSFAGAHDVSPLSLEQFRSQSIHGQYTPITLHEISELFSEYDDLILVTDKSNNFDLILEQYDHHERLIVEVFSLENYQLALQTGVLFPALNTEFSPEHQEYIASNKVRIIAFSTAHLSNEYTLELARQYHANGVSSMVYSTSDAKFIAEHIGRSATMFYTDFWSLEEQRCVHTNPNACLSQF